MNHGKRFLALMLAVILTVSVFPVSVFAGNNGKDLGYYKGEKEYKLDVIPATAVSDEGVLVVAGSDFQDPATNNTSSSNASAYAAQVSRITNIMTEIKAHYSSDNIVSYGFFAGGDYMYESNGSKNKTNLGISQVKGAVTSVLGADTNTVFIQGNHDYTGANYDAGGAHDTDYYGVFSINEDDYESKVSSDVKTKASAKALDNYLSEKKTAGYTKPVFIITHVPLHYSTRTKAEKDAMYAYYLYEVVEKYGDDLNIIFLYGHDHAWGDDDYLGGSSVYLEKGSTINIAGTRSGNTVTPSQNSYVTLPINFTYMNYGYTGYYYSSWNTHEAGAADSTLTMTSFYISGGDVEIIRWSETADAANGGMHVLKAAGHATKGMRGVSEVCTVTDNVVNSPFMLGLNGYVPPVVPEEPPVTPGEPDPDDPEPEDVSLEDEDSGVGIATTAGSDVAVEEGDNSQTYAIIEKYVSYNITVADFVNGTDHATVSIPVPTGFDSSRIRVYFRDTDGSLTDMNARVENGNVVFSTDHFSEYLLAEGAAADIDGWVPVSGSGSYTYTLDTDGINSGAQYIIVGQSGSNYVFTGANNGTGSGNGQSVDISNDNKITLSSNDYEWTFTQNGSYYNISQGSAYMYYDDSSSNPAEIKTQNTAYNWTVANESGSYRIGKPGTNRTIRYNNGFGIGNSDGNRVRLFRQTSVPAAAYYLGLDAPENITVTLGRYTTQAALIAYLKTVIGVYRADDTAGTGIAPVTDYSVTVSGSIPTGSAGSVSCTVVYNGVTVGSFDVSFAAKTVTGIAYKNPAKDITGEIYQSAKNGGTGAYLTVTYDNDSADTADIEITLDMLSPVAPAEGGFDKNTLGSYPNLTVSYGGQTLTGFTLNVVQNPDENDYPDYPNQGSVKVNKTGTAIDWTSTGVAQIELSTMGVPLNKGVDIILMLDTSSSMTSNKVENGPTRLAVMQESLKNMMDELEKPNPDGSIPDVRVAIADFNGYGQISASDKITNNVQSATNAGKVYTGPNQGTKVYDENAFVAPSTVTDAMINAITATSGTNYDYAFETTYQLGQAIKAANAAAGEDRELVVVFMSDGCSFQYNYYITESGFTNQVNQTGGPTTDWNAWLLGTFDTANGGQYWNASTHKYFYYPDTAADGQKIQRHWMAEAIKGSPDQMYPVIVNDGSKYLDSAKYPNQDYLESVGVSSNSLQYMTEYPGLGATMYSIGFCLADDKDTHTSGVVKETTAHNVKYLASLDANGSYRYSSADSADELDAIFTEIAHNLTYAATDAYFVDIMGLDYDLQMASYVGSENAPVSLAAHGITPSIVVKEYEIYKSTDTDIPEGKEIGQRKNNAPAILETVTFNAAGTEAYSDQINASGTNILDDGLICAKTFWYNTDKTETKMIDTDGDNVPDCSLKPETFYWKIGIIGEKEIALCYYVYLTGSIEGECPDGDYPTNKDAILYYKNWLGHDVYQDTVSPVLPWGAAKVNYAFYLVDTDGHPIVNRTTMETGSFAYKIAITNPVVGAKIYLNASGGFDNDAEGGIYVQDLLNACAIPEGYSLYDTGAGYTVHPSSDNRSSYWFGTSADDKNNPYTTYVTGYKSDEFLTVGSGIPQVNSSDDAYADYTFNNTTVWFALTLDQKVVPDTVVIDFGLPVDINVIANDMFGNYGSLQGIGKDLPRVDGEDVTYTALPSSSYADILPETVLNYGSAAIAGGKVRYTPKTMQMDDVEKFAYSVKYNNGDPESILNGYYYANVTVVPATVIYYEENFVSFSSQWTDVGTDAGGTQAEDRPGFGGIGGLDADNIYGYDAAYANSGTYSHGAAKKVTVTSTDTDYPTATFTFTGTGFDLISMTSNTTGAIAVDVYAGAGTSGTKNKSWAVDTYYGYSCVQDETNPYIERTYTYGTDGNWHVTEKAVSVAGENGKAEKPYQVGDSFVTYTPNYRWEKVEGSGLYQIPVIKGSGFDYGTYTVVITPSYAKFFDHNKSGSYDFYLDAVRIYGPADESDAAKTVYAKDGEAEAQFIELRKQIISAAAASTGGLVSGAAFVDGFGASGSFSDYQNFGPNHEVYLAPGQAIVFRLAAENGSNVHLAAKGVAGASAVTVTGVNNKEKEVSRSIALNTATDLYYDISDLVFWSGTEDTSNTITIANTGTGVLSLTNLKVTAKALSAAGGGENSIKAALVVSEEIAQNAANAMFQSLVRENTSPEAVPETPRTIHKEKIQQPVIKTPGKPIVPIVPVVPVTPAETKAAACRR